MQHALHGNRSQFLFANGQHVLLSTKNHEPHRPPQGSFKRPRRLRGKHEMSSIHLPLCRFTLLTSHASSSHFINTQDVSNRFNAECSKQAKAVASKQAKAAKAKSNKRAVSTLYLPTAPDASMK